VTSTLAVFEATILAKINVYDNIIIENQKKERKYVNHFLHKSSSKISFRNGIYSLLKRADARDGADIIYHKCDTYR